MMAFSIDWAVARDRFYQQQPMPIDVMDDNVWHLAVAINRYAKLREPLPIKIAQFLAGIACVYQHTSRRKSWCELGYNITD